MLRTPRATRPLALPFLALLVGIAASCTREPTPAAANGRDRQAVLAEVDTVLMELGGGAAMQLQRGQRWRMISSVGAGLPPPGFEAPDLPEAGSRSAALVEAYCVQCHWLPAPQMHSAAEWPVLQRRMLMRAQTLHQRMGGPMTEELMGEILLSGMASAAIPSPEDADSLLAYLQRNAMPAIDPADLGPGEETAFFVGRCGLCHETPSPAAHTASEWEAVVGRMQGNMALMGVAPLTDQEARRVLAFLKDRARPE